MPRSEKVAQYIQRLAYESLVQHEDRDDRPEDAPPGLEPTPSYANWNATSFSAYVPFRTPPHG